MYTYLSSIHRVCTLTYLPYTEYVHVLIFHTPSMYFRTLRTYTYLSSVHCVCTLTYLPYTAYTLRMYTYLSSVHCVCTLTYLSYTAYVHLLIFRTLRMYKLTYPCSNSFVHLCIYQQQFICTQISFMLIVYF